MLYKFMDKKYVPSLLSGSMMIRSLRYFREMEGDEWIADRMEGRVEADMNFVHSPSNENFREVNDDLRKLGITNESEGQITFVNSKAGADFGDIFVFCCSLGPFEAARKAMCEDAPADQRYDGCVQIESIQALSKTLFETATLNGHPLAKSFMPVGSKEISYTKVISDFTSGLPTLDPFTKPEKFKDQREYRIAFFPKTLTKPEFDYREPLFVKFDPRDVLSELAV